LVAGLGADSGAGKGSNYGNDNSVTNRTAAVNNNDDDDTYIGVHTSWPGGKMRKKKVHDFQ